MTQSLKFFRVQALRSVQHSAGGAEEERGRGRKGLELPTEVRVSLQKRPTTIGARMALTPRLELKLPAKRRKRTLQPSPRLCPTAAGRLTRRKHWRLRSQLRSLIKVVVEVQRVWVQARVEVRVYQVRV